MSSNEYRGEVVVIGGGVAGLAASALIARNGNKVRLFEQSHLLGGRAQTKEHDGFYLNLGPHALYRGGRGMQVLRELGFEPRGKVPSVSGAFATKSGVKHTFPAGAVSLLTTSLFGLPAKLEAARFLASIAKIDASRFMSVSAREWLDQSLSHVEVKEFVLAAFRVATYTNAPELMSAGAAIEQLQKAFATSVLYLDGGWQTIVESLRDSCERAGVVLEIGSRVDCVTRDSQGSVDEVQLSDGRLIKASVVVIAASPSVALRLVEDSDMTALKLWADSAIPVRAASLDVALSRLPIPKATFALGIDKPTYFSVHSAAAQLAPEGGALIHAAKYLSPDDHDSAAAEVELEQSLDLVQPGWREAVVYRRFLPDMIVMNAMPLATDGGTLGRPGPEVPNVRGLYVVGDWVGKEGMLVDASLASASQVAALIGAAQPASVAAMF